MPSLPKYHTHIDSLYLSFDTIDLVNFRFDLSNHYKIHPITTDEGYSNSFAVYSTFDNTMVHFATINHQRIVKPMYSTLTLSNKVLYCPSWSNVLNHLIADLRLNVQIRKIELAVDTPINILKRLHTKYMNSESLVIEDKRYEFINFGSTKKLKKYGYKKYFEDIATQRLQNVKSSTISQFDRFENKRIEIDEHSHKTYIDNYLAQYFDTSTLYRYEKTLFFEDLTYKNDVFVNNDTGEAISAHLYDKLNSAIQYSYTKHIEYNYVDIDFSKLEDHLYLTSLFNNYALFNYDIILNTVHGIPHFAKKYVKRFKLVKPTNRSLTLANNLKTIQNIQDEFDRINNMYIIDNVSTDEINKRRLEILFNTPIKPVYTYKYGDWLI